MKQSTVDGAPHNWQKNLNYVCVRAYVCTFVCMCLCQRIALSYPEIFAIPVQSSLKIDFRNRSKISLLPIHHCFSILGLGMQPSLWWTNILVFWESEEEYVRAKCQRAAQPHINPSEFIFYFACWGYGLTRKKLLQVIWRELRQRFIMGTKNNLIWGFWLVATPKIPFGQHRIH